MSCCPGVASKPLSCLVSILLVASWGVPGEGRAGQDWEVRGDADGLLLVNDEDDGLDGNAEISLTVEWVHLDDERDVLTQKTTTMEIDHNWDVSNAQLGGLGLAQQLRTVECDEGDFIFVNARLAESDMINNFETVLATGAGIAVGITVATVLAPSGPGAVAGGALAAKVAGGVAGALSGALFKWLGSGVEDLGTIEAQKLNLGANQFQLAGSGGGGSVVISDNSVQSANVAIECARGPLQPPQPVDPTTAVDGIYPLILAGLAEVPNIQREDRGGQAADVEMRQFRLAIAETLTSLGEAAAVYFVYQSSTGFAGAAASLPLLEQGRQHVDAGEFVDATIDFREAFRTAYTAYWNGNPAPAYSLASHLTLFAPVRVVEAGIYQEFSGWAQGLGPDEIVDAVDVTGQTAGMAFRSFSGVARSGFILAGDLSPALNEDSLIGLARASGGVIDAPDAGCDVPHYEEGSIGAGIFIDGDGPFAEPDPAGCGYGPVIDSYQNFFGGGVPLGVGPDIDGLFTLELDPGPGLPPGDHELTVTAQVRDTVTMATREISAPLRLLVRDPDALFSDGFEAGLMP